MGLDMYLERYPKVGSHTFREVDLASDYIRWGKGDKKYSFNEWHGECDVDFDLVEAIRAEYKPRHPAWSTDEDCMIESAIQNVAYWRKANAIHGWFVDNVQDGDDGYDEYRDVTEADLRELLAICKEVLDSSVMVRGHVINGYVVENGTFHANYEDGYVIANEEVADNLLPTRSGFFFGSTEYDEYYLNDVAETIKQLETVLQETDFDKYGLHYIASW